MRTFSWKGKMRRVFISCQTALLGPKWFCQQTWGWQNYQHCGGAIYFNWCHHLCVTLLWIQPWHILDKLFTISNLCNIWSLYIALTPLSCSTAHLSSADNSFPFKKDVILVHSFYPKNILQLILSAVISHFLNYHFLHAHSHSPHLVIFLLVICVFFLKHLLCSLFITLVLFVLPWWSSHLS